LLEFCIVAAGAINSLWDVLKDEVEVDFVFLECGLDRVDVEEERIKPTFSPFE
jgi:hypothetical protein